MSKDTRIHLVQDIEKAIADGKVTRNPLVQQILVEAMQGEFHDYKNEKYTCGKVAANDLLTRAGLPELAAKIRDGEYDEKADEDDRANMARGIDEDKGSTPAQKAALKRMLGL